MKLLVLFRPRAPRKTDAPSALGHRAPCLLDNEVDRTVVILRDSAIVSA
jgi:hypothetical protein